MPVTSVPKISGATITLISRRNMSPNTRKCTANCGRSIPTSKPASMAKKIQKVSERPRSPETAMTANPSQRTMADTFWKGSHSASRTPAAESSSPATNKVFEVFDAYFGKPLSLAMTVDCKKRRHHSVSRQKERNRITRAGELAAHFGDCYRVKMPKINYLECSRCRERASAETPQ